MNLKKLDNEDKILIGAGIFSVLAIGYAYYRKKQRDKQEANAIKPIIEEPIKSIPQLATPKITNNTLDSSKILRFGSKGLEVKALQKKLGIRQDGDFGKITQTALKNTKGVLEISLENYNVVKNQKTTLATKIIPKKGQKLMGIKEGFSVFAGKKLANGAIINSGNKSFTKNYGEDVGTFIRTHAQGWYAVSIDGRQYFVREENVKPF